MTLNFMVHCTAGSSIRVTWFGGFFTFPVAQVRATPILYVVARARSTLIYLFISTGFEGNYSFSLM